MRRDASRLATRPEAPSYPQFTGFEPCAQIGVGMYVLAEGAKHTQAELKVLRDGCAVCPLQVECLEWALHRERWGFFGGKTQSERDVMRSLLGITVQEPHYEILGLRDVESGDDDGVAA